jgi:5-methylcytosine-specific restriction enzyme A
MVITMKTNTTITKEMVAKSYEVGKQFYDNEISRTDGITNLTQIGMNQSSASGYIYQYSNLIQGKLYTRTTNAFASEYYLNKIYLDNGKQSLQKALLSLSQQSTIMKKSDKLPSKNKEKYTLNIYPQLR